MCRCGCPRPHRRWTSWLLVLAVLAVALAATAVGGARGEVFHSKESALRLAFPEADSVVTRNLVVTEEQAERIREIARTELPSRLISVHVGLAGGSVTGYAFIETHKVRSLPETLLIVVGPGGETRGVHLLAFHEPKEYMPPDRWLEQFDDRPLDASLALRRGIAGISGSTLTATAITASVRRVLATAEVCLSGTGTEPQLTQGRAMSAARERGGLSP